MIYFEIGLGVVAQLVRAPACHAGGRGFESRLSRHSQSSSDCVNVRPKSTIKRIFRVAGPFRIFCKDLLDLKFEVNGKKLVRVKEGTSNYRFDLVE